MPSRTMKAAAFRVANTTPAVQGWHDTSHSRHGTPGWGWKFTEWHSPPARQGREEGEEVHAAGQASLCSRRASSSCCRVVQTCNPMLGATHRPTHSPQTRRPNQHPPTPSCMLPPHTHSTFQAKISSNHPPTRPPTHRPIPHQTHHPSPTPPTTPPPTHDAEAQQEVEEYEQLDGDVEQQLGQVVPPAGPVRGAVHGWPEAPPPQCAV